jgi:hypothetical protein
MKAIARFLRRLLHHPTHDRGHWATGTGNPVADAISPDRRRVRR